MTQDNDKYTIYLDFAARVALKLEIPWMKEATPGSAGIDRYAILNLAIKHNHFNNGFLTREGFEKQYKEMGL